MVFLFAALSARFSSQLPTYDGTKSYQNLLVEVYGEKGPDGYYGQDPQVHMDTILQNNPISNVRGGHYTYNTGNIENRNNQGYYWLSNVSNDIDANDLGFHSNALRPRYNGAKGNGFTLRCLVPLEAWQLPTHSGTKSYQNLLVEVYGALYTDGSSGRNKADTNIQFSPVYLIRSGDYVHSSGNIDGRGSDGTYWESNPTSTTNARYLVFYFSLLSPQYNSNKGSGRTLRCLAPLEFYSGPLATPYLQWY